MPNILEEYNATSEQRIDDKTEIYSVTTGDVGSTIREGVELALLYPQASILRTYPKDFITRDGAYNLFISLADNVNGDTTNGANWQPLSSGISQSVYDLGVIADDFANGYEATVPAIVTYSTSNIYLFKPDVSNTGASTLQINALSVLPIKKYSSGAIVDVASGDLDLANTYLLIYKSTYFLIASGGASSGGGSGTSLTDTITAGELLSQRNIVYLKSDGKYWKADNTVESKCSTELRIVTDATILANATGQSLRVGLLAGFSGLTVGVPYFLSTSGSIIVTLPEVDGIFQRYVGTAKSATEFEFNPDETWIELTTNSPSGGGFDPLVDDIGDITPVNSVIVDNDTVNVFASKTQGQINNLQPLDSDLTAIAALTPSNDDVIQRKSGAWTNRSLAQLITDFDLYSIFVPLVGTNLFSGNLETQTGTMSVGAASTGVGYSKVYFDAGISTRIEATNAALKVVKFEAILVGPAPNANVSATDGTDTRRIFFFCNGSYDFYDDVLTIAGTISNASIATKINANEKALITKRYADDRYALIGAGVGITRSVVVTSGNTTLGGVALKDYVCLVVGNHTITLPTAVGNTNRYTIKNNHSADININTTSSQTIDGATSIVISPEDSVDIISNGTNWNII